MKTEGIIAVIFGIIFGGILGFFLITKNLDYQFSKNKFSPTKKRVTEKKIENNQKSNILPLTIESPKNNMISYQNSIKISFQAMNDSLVVIQSPIKDLILKTTKNKETVDFPLVYGENVIKITVYPKDKNLSIQEKTLNIYYLKEEI